MTKIKLLISIIHLNYPYTVLVLEPVLLNTKLMLHKLVLLNLCHVLILLDSVIFRCTNSVFQAYQVCKGLLANQLNVIPSKIIRKALVILWLLGTEVNEFAYICLILEARFGDGSSFAVIVSHRFEWDRRHFS